MSNLINDITEVEGFRETFISIKNKHISSCSPYYTAGIVLDVHKMLHARHKSFIDVVNNDKRPCSYTPGLIDEHNSPLQSERVIYMVVTRGAKPFSEGVSPELVYNGELYIIYFYISEETGPYIIFVVRH